MGLIIREEGQNDEMAEWLKRLKGLKRLKRQ
jgi:hypothetical protein